MHDPAVVACGGGVVLEPANRITLRNTGVAVFLDVPLEQLRDRVRPAADRPLIREEGDLERLLSDARAALPRVRGPRRRRRRARRARSPTPSWRSSVGPRDRPDPGAVVRRLRRLGRDRVGSGRCCRSSRAHRPRSWWPTDGLRRVVRVARVVAGCGGAGDGPAHRARRRGGEDAAGVRDAAASARHAGGAPRRPRGRARRGSGRRSRRVRGLDVHARRAVHPGADHAAGAGRRGDRRQDRRQPARGQEPGGDVLAAAAGGRRCRHAAHPVGARLPLGTGGGGEVRSHAGRRAPGHAGARPGADPGARPGHARAARGPLRLGEGADGRRGRARRRRSPVPELRAHPGPRARAARGVRGAFARRSDRHRHGVRGTARRGARTSRPTASPRARCDCSRRSDWRPTGRCRVPTTILAAFRLDKKYRGGVRFVLLRDVGRPWSSTTSPTTNSEGCCRRWERAYEGPLPVRSQPGRAGHARSPDVRRRRRSPRSWTR